MSSAGRRTTTHALATFAVTSFASVAAAQSIDWRAPRECPRLVDVRPWLDAVLPDDVRDQAADVRVEVEIVRDGGRFRARLRVTRGAFEGLREVDGTRCEEVARAAVIAMSVALTEAVQAPAEPTVDAQELPPAQVESAPATPVVPEVSTEEDADTLGPPRRPAARPRPRSTAPRRPGRSPRNAMLLEGGFTVGIGDPAIAPRVGLGYARAVGPGLTLGLSLVSMPWVAVRSGGELAASLTSFGLGFDACGGIGAGGFKLGGCLGLSGEVVRAEGQSVWAPTRGRTGLIALQIGGYVEFGGASRLRISPEIHARLLRPRVTLSDGTVLATTTPAGFALSLAFVRDFL